MDELPQLLNILVGDMSLIGPRPLLPEDQPADPTIRLMIRPGITGWAQVNGGKQITSEEKDDLDEWYIHNASLSLDLHILLLTCRYVLVGNRASASLSGKEAQSKPGSEVGRPEQISVALKDAKDARRSSFRVRARHIPLQSKPLESVAVAAAKPAPSVTK